jgi:hypothetical protein
MTTEPKRMIDIHIKLVYHYRETLSAEEAEEKFGTSDIDEIDSAVSDTLTDNLQEYYDESDFEDSEVDVSEY